MAKKTISKKADNLLSLVSGYYGVTPEELDEKAVADRLISLEALLFKVSQTFGVQKHYFKTKCKVALNKAINLEAQCTQIIDLL